MVTSTVGVGVAIGVGVSIEQLLSIQKCFNCMSNYKPFSPPLEREAAPSAEGALRTDGW